MENLQKEFVTYQQALKLKEIGFNEPCFGWYQSGRLKKEYGPLKNSGNQSYMRKEDCNAPTYSAAFRWFREKHNLFHSVDRIFKDEFGYTITPGDNEPINCFNFNDWDSAESNCLDKLIEIVEPKEQQ